MLAQQNKHQYLFRGKTCAPISAGNQDEADDPEYH
jgi:hypothetical protein